MNLEFVTLLLFRVPTLILAHMPDHIEWLHRIKILEAKIHKAFRPKKRVQAVKVEVQPWIEDGWIRCGDPNCKTMHKINRAKAKSD